MEGMYGKYRYCRMLLVMGILCIVCMSLALYAYYVWLYTDGSLLTFSPSHIKSHYPQLIRELTAIENTIPLGAKIHSINVQSNTIQIEGEVFSHSARMLLQKIFTDWRQITYRDNNFILKKVL